MFQVDKLLIAELLEAYKLQRHDFLNHCQVASGYLQMNHGEKALRYIRSMLPELEAEQKLSQIPQISIAACILRLIIHLRKEGISLELNIPAEWKKQEFWAQSWQEEYLQDLYGYTSECLELSLSQKDRPLKAVLNLGKDKAHAESSTANNESELKFRFELHSQSEETGNTAVDKIVAVTELSL